MNDLVMMPSFDIYMYFLTIIELFGYGVLGVICLIALIGFFSDMFSRKRKVK